MSADIKQSLVGRLTRNIRDDVAWAELFKIEAQNRAVGNLLSLLAQRHELRGDAAQFTLFAVESMALHRDWDCLDALYKGMAKDSAFHGFFAYGAALAAARRFDLDATARLLREAAFAAMTSFKQVFSREPTNVMTEVIFQAGLIEKSGYGTGAPPPVELDLPTLSPPGLLFFSCCDEIYFAAYGERFLRALNAAVPDACFLIHVINPTENGHAARARLAHAYPAGAFSFETGPKDTAFYASRRYMLCGTVRQRYRTDVAMIDLDAAFPGDFPALLARARRAQVAYIVPHNQILPTLLIHGVLVTVQAAGAAADKFLDRTSAYLHRKFRDGESMWFIDQAALFRSICLARQEKDDVIDLGADIPDLPNRFVGGHVVSDQERMSWPSRNRRIEGVTFDSDLRPTFKFAAAPS